MPYITEIPSHLLSVGLDGVVAFVPNTQLLNAFGTSEPFAQYDVDQVQGPATLSSGDNITPVDATGAPLTAAVLISTQN